MARIANLSHRPTPSHGRTSPNCTSTSTRSPGGRRIPEGGQAVPLLAVALVLAGALSLGLVHLATQASRRAAAQAAADAAALAGAAEGQSAAAAMAQANRAALVAFTQDGDDVEVTVSSRGATASARARWVPPPEPPPTPSSDGTTSGAEGYSDVFGPPGSHIPIYRVPHPR